MALTLDYDYFLVCAFEFTCDGKRSQEPQEIIELCILKYCLKSQSVVDRFYSLAKPQHPINAQLSTFCKMLTCISDRKLTNAPSLRDLLIDFDRWMWKQGLFQARFIFVPHTYFDLSHMLPEQCRAMGYHLPAYFFSWLNLEELHKQFQSRQVSNKPAKKQITRRNSKTLLNSFGVQQEGRLHSAVDNCNNTVNLIRSMTERGIEFNGKVWHYKEDSEKDSNEDGIDAECNLEELEEDKTIALFSRASSRVGFSRSTSSASGRVTPATSGRCTPNRSGRSSPVKGLFSGAPLMTTK